MLLHLFILHRYELQYAVAVAGRAENGDMADWQLVEGDSKDTWDVTVRLDRFEWCKANPIRRNVLAA